MKNWFANLLNPRQEPAGEAVPPAHPGTDAEIRSDSAQPAQGSTELLNLQKEVQALRMEVAAREDSIVNLKQEVERLRLRQEGVIAETVSARLSGLFGELAAPASQILTQADLLERQGKPVQARDVLSVARRMVRALERYGVSFIGQVGEQAVFDPNQHTPINGPTLPQTGQPVTIRFAGVAFQGNTIYKAIVE